MKVRAKFVVASIKKHAFGNNSVTVELMAVSADGVPENEKFSKYPPSGRIEMIVDNPPVAEYFEGILGHYVYVDFNDSSPD